MNKSIDPYDLGKVDLIETCQKIDINEFIKVVNARLKEGIISSKINALGFNIMLATSNTRFQGKRFWFICPNCGRRTGIIYKHPVLDKLGCRKCFNLKYKKQRYKGMIESLI